MPHIESSIVINGPLEEVYKLAKNVESFPEFMSDVKSVTVLEKSEDGNRVVTEWVGIVKEFNTTIKWVEEDIWDDEKHECRFSLVKGDYGAYGGVWKFYAINGGTKWDSSLDFEYDVPLIGALIKNLIAKKMKENLDNMLAACKKKIEGGQ